MGSKNLNIAIESHFDNNWSETDVVYDNVPFDATLSPYVSLYVIDGDSSKASLGPAPQIRRHTGTVFVDIYTVLDSGAKYGRQLADSVCGIFRDVVLSPTDGKIHFLEPSVKNMRQVYHAVSGASKGSTPWHQIVVTIPYFYDEIV